MSPSRRLTSAEALAAAVHGQPGSGARFDWGLTGAAELGRVCAALVVVDVLSFTTSVEVAVARGMRVHPFPWVNRPRTTRCGSARPLRWGDGR